ncbi:MAG: hypothetical protein Q4B26_00435 [Eubacteriales bacterium]|nr:hypothetical protein [Eubacteriales bacterium]
MQNFNEDGTVVYNLPIYREANFDTSSDSSGGNRNGRTLWYKEADFSNIPTLYEGDQLIIKSDTAIAQDFTFERFEYVGYTIGISDINQLRNGRFYINTKSETMDDGIIARNSDAYKLFSLNSNVTIIDKIGGAKLKEGNLTRGKVINGLEKDKTYEAEIYVGSKKYVYPLKADVIAMTSMDSETTSDYTYYDGELVAVDIPDNLNTGYYSCNHSGLFRLVRSKSYSDVTNFNVPNNALDKTKETDEEIIETITEDQNATQVENVTIDNDGMYLISITYDDQKGNVSEGTSLNPRAKIVTNSGAYTFTRDAEKAMLSMDVSLTAGQYRVEIDDLYGADYSISVEKSTVAEVESDGNL